MKPIKFISFVKQETKKPNLDSVFWHTLNVSEKEHLIFDGVKELDDRE